MLEDIKVYSISINTDVIILVNIISVFIITFIRYQLDF